MDFTVSGDISSFDLDAFRINLASMLPGIEAADIRASVSAASVRVDVVIDAASTSVASTAQQSLESVSLTQLSSTLGVTVESTTTPVVLSTVISGSPPSLPAPAPPAASLTALQLTNPAVSVSIVPSNPSLYPASNAIDGNTGSLAATGNALSRDQWISVRVPSGSAIGYVAVYNRADGQPYQGWLSPYEVWLGGTAGALTFNCGGGPITLPANAALGPFLTSCGGRSDLPHVTVLLRSGTSRYLTLSEIKVYQA